MGSAIDKDLERGIFMTPSKQNQNSNLLDPSPSSKSVPARIDEAGKKKYVKQVTGRHNDTELHLAVQRGDLASVKRILDEINSQFVGTSSGVDFDAEVAKTRALVVNEVNKLGETALYVAAEKGHLEVVKELLKYSDKDTLTRQGRLKFNPLHIAACQGHHDIVKLLLDHDVSLCQTRSRGNATPLITAALKGHTAVVEELLLKDPTLVDIPISNGKNALHLAARSGHVETVKSLLQKDPQLAHRADKKGQTALHVAVKGTSSEVVKLLLCLPDTNVNALTRHNKTALDIAEELFPSEESTDIRAYLARSGAVQANELNQPLDELRNTVTQIKNDVHTIAKEVKKLHREGFNNYANSVTVAVLFATISFAAIFTVPGGENDDGTAVAVNRLSFQVFFVFDALALYTSLAVVLVQTTMTIQGKTKAEREMIETINRLLWLASVCTLVAFMASSYIVISRKHEWVAINITTCGVFIMVGTLITLTYYKSKKTWSIRRKKVAKSRTNS